MGKWGGGVAGSGRKSENDSPRGQPVLRRVQGGAERLGPAEGGSELEHFIPINQWGPVWVESCPWQTRDIVNVI